MARRTDVLALEHAGQHFPYGDLGLHVFGGFGEVHVLAGDFKDDLFGFLDPAAGDQPAGGFLEVAQADDEGDEADAAEIEDVAPRLFGEGDDCAAHDADDRDGGEADGGDEVLPLAARFGGGHFGDVRLRTDHEAEDAEAGHGAGDDEYVEVVGKPVEHGEERERRDGDEEGPAPSDEVGDHAADEAAGGHADEVPERDRPDVRHVQSPCVHEGRGDEAEVPVVHLLAEVGHHDDEEDDLVESRHRHVVEIVVGNFPDCCLAHNRFSKSRFCSGSTLFSVVYTHHAVMMTYMNIQWNASFLLFTTVTGYSSISFRSSLDV